MFYANLSYNGRVSREGLNYTHVYLEEDFTSLEQIQIPFIGFSNSDFIDLPSGNLILLSPFDVFLIKGKLALVKGYDTRNMLLVMYSVPWREDGFLGEILGGRAPESVFKFKTGHVSEAFYHEYLLFIHRDLEYRFGYYSEDAESAFFVSMFWGKGTDELVIKYFDPKDY